MGKRAHGEGSICRRTNGTFEGKLTLKASDGSVVRKSFYGKTRGAIADKMREYREEHRTSVATHSAVMLANYLTTWLNALSIRPSTFKLREHMIRKHIVPHIGTRKLSELTSDDVRFLLRRWKDDDVGLVTQRTAFVTLSCALNVAFREGKIARNPCETVPPPKPPRPEVSVLDGKQVMKLLAASRKTRDRALLTLAVTTGMRQGEIFALTWDDVDLAARTISIKRTLAQDRHGHLVRSEPKTPKSRRVIYLPELAQRANRASRRRELGKRLRLHVGCGHAAAEEQLSPARLQAAAQAGGIAGRDISQPSPHRQLLAHRSGRRSACDRGQFGAFGHPDNVRALRPPVRPYGQARRPNRRPDFRGARTQLSYDCRKCGRSLR